MTNFKDPLRFVRALAAIFINLLVSVILTVGRWFTTLHKGSVHFETVSEGLCVVTPISPSDLSGGSKAVKDLLNMFLSHISISLIELPSSVETISKIGKRIAETLMSGIPMLRTSAHSVFGNEEIGKRIQKGRAVFIEFSEGAAFLLLRRRMKNFTVLRDHEIVTRRFERPDVKPAGIIALWREKSAGFLCRAFLSNTYSKVDMIVTLTKEDGDYIRRHFKGAGDKVVTIPVVFDYSFTSKVKRDGDRGVERSKEGEKELLFLANLFHAPNLEGLEWFLYECAPHLEPGFTLHLCGMDAPLDRRPVSAENISIIRHGYVEDVESELGHVRIGVSPVISGGGTRIKNLYLGATGRVVVTTPLGNEGIGFRDGEEAIIRSNGYSMAMALNAIAKDPRRIRQIGTNAAQKIKEEFSPERIWRYYNDEVFKRHMVKSSDEK